jgi:hypothetical protein
MLSSYRRRFGTTKAVLILGSIYLASQIIIGSIIHDMGSRNTLPACSSEDRKAARVEMEGAAGAGQSDYHEYNTDGGLLMPQIKLPDFPHFFQIFETGERLVDATPVPATGGVARWLTALALLRSIRRCHDRRGGRTEGRSTSLL